MGRFWSDEQLSAHQPAGLIVNPVIFAELCVNASDPAEVNRILGHLKLKFAEIPRVALFTAAKAFLAYRKRGGAKTSPLPDFFIGAHAETTETPLLTRDPSRFRTYFPKARVIAPAPLVPRTRNPPNPEELPEPAWKRRKG